MAKQKLEASDIPKFANEREEAKWWASPKGREFVKAQSARRSKKPSGGSPHQRATSGVAWMRRSSAVSAASSGRSVMGAGASATAGPG